MDVDLKYIIKKHFMTGASLLFLIIFSVFLKTYANPLDNPPTPYSPGETLNPTCYPSTNNCTVSVASSNSFLTEKQIAFGNTSNAIASSPNLTFDSNVLTINGNIKITDGTQSNGKVLTSDAAGLATWQTPSGVSAGVASLNNLTGVVTLSEGANIHLNKTGNNIEIVGTGSGSGSGTGWALSGNTGTTSSNFLGTLDDVPLIFRVDGTLSGMLDSAVSKNTFYGYQAGMNSISSGGGGGGTGTITGFNLTNGGSGYTSATVTIDPPTSGTRAEATAIISSGGVAQNEKQTITPSLTPTGGTYTITFGADTTTVLNWDANIATIQAALEALASIGTGNISVSVDGSSIVLEFIGTLANTPESLVTGTSLLTKDIGATIVGTTSQSITFDNVPTSGDWTLSYGSATTGSLAYNISATDLQTAIQGLDASFPTATPPVTVTGDFTSGFTVDFSGITSPSTLTMASNTLKISVDAVIAESQHGSAGGGSGVITGFSITNAGTGYTTTPVGVTITGDGSNAAATANADVGGGGGGGAINSGNVFLGYQAGYWETGNDNLYIDNQQRTLSDAKLKSLIYGKFNADTANQFVTINGALNVNGPITVADGTQGAGKVLTSTDNTGVATWQTPSSGSGGGWALNDGNTLTGTEFLGSNNNIPLVFKVNNQLAGKIDGTLHNTFFGYQAGNLSMTGNGNTSIGDSSLSLNSTGEANTANGYGAMNSNTTGYDNTAIGYVALISNSTGNFNNANGYQSLMHNTTGSYNFASGYNSLYSNVSGNGNSAIGTGALYSNVSGDNNIALGYNAGYYETGNDNLYIDNQQRTLSDAKLKSLIYGKFDDLTAHQYININGSLGILDASGNYYSKFTGGTQGGPINYTLPATSVSGQLTNDGSGILSWATAGGNNWALSGNSVDDTDFIGTTNNKPLIFKMHNQLAGKIDASNTFLGSLAGNLTMSGTNNIALGPSALFRNTTGHDNTAIALSTLVFNTTGNYNTAIGPAALFANTTGNENTAIGNQALVTNTTGNSNTAIGIKALNSNTTGSNNTVIGYYGLYNDQVGNNNIAIGNYAGAGENNSNSLYIDSLERGHMEDKKLKSLIYGKFDADPANQFVNINGTLGILDSTGNYYSKFTGGDQTTAHDINYILPTTQGGASTVLTNNGSGSLSWNAQGTVAINPQTNDYILVIGDAGKLIEMNKGTAVSLTVPLDSSVSFPVGTTISVIQKGAGKVNFVAASGVTINSKNGLHTSGQFAGGTLIKVDTNIWYLNGDISSS